MTTIGVDIYDGHLLITEADGDDLYHYIEHPPTCHGVAPHPEQPSYVQHWCPPAYHQEAINEWPEATSPGVRIIGWRHDTYGYPYVEHDLVAFTVGPPLRCLPHHRIKETDRP